MFQYLMFSDAAKYADVARNIISGAGYKTTFSFFFKPFFTGQWIPPVMPFSIAAFFKIFGVTDFAVIATSFFYFLLTLTFVFLLAKSIYKSNLIGILSLTAVGFNYDIINYATRGASESPFIFEIVAATYLVSLKKKIGDFGAFVILILMYFTRPQAFIYIAGVILYYLLLNFKTKKGVLYFIAILVIGLLIDIFVLRQLSGKFFLYSILGRGSNILSQVGIGQSASDQLRSGVLTYDFSIFESSKKIFYNLYNFYKLLPQILNPYLVALFIIGIFIKNYKEAKTTTIFKTVSVFMVLVTLIVTATSIPFFRYIHPVIPLIYIIAIGTLFEFITSKKILIFLVLIFGIGQTLGVVFLDSRFEKQTHNVGKPPVYVLLSQKLKENTKPSQTIVTNLDTWGSWYGERKTIWFPIEPSQIAVEKIDAIYLTSYLMDDQNYYMGDSWRKIFNDPEKQTILKDFKYVGTYTFDANSNYERQASKGVLLVRK